MERLDKITKFQLKLLVLFYVTYYLPLRSKGSIVPKVVYISSLNIGLIFHILAIVLIVAFLVAKIREFKQNNIIIIVTFSLLLTLELMYYIGRSTYSMNLSWYIRIGLVAILFLSHFAGEQTLKVVNQIKEYSQKAFDKIIDFISTIGTSANGEVVEGDFEEVDEDFEDYKA